MFNWFRHHTATDYPEGAIVQFGDHAVHVVRRGRGGSVRLSVVKNGDIHLSAGVLVSDETITRFCEERLDVLVERYRSRPHLELTEPTPEQLARLQAVLPERYRYWCERMGVTESVPYSYSRARSYWGKCYPRQRRIVFSIHLSQRDDRMLDYVIVHELAHLTVPHHNRAFYTLVAQYIPDYKQILRQNKH